MTTSTRYVPGISSILIQTREKRDQEKIIPYQYYGLFIYPKLPKGMKIATLDDFLSNGLIRIGLDFLVKCSSTEEYEAHKVGEDTINKWSRHIEAERVFIKQI